MWVFIKPFLYKATEFMSKLLAQLSAILFALAIARACFSGRLSHCVCASLYSTCTYLKSLDIDFKHVVFIYLKEGTVLHAPEEGISSVQCYGQ